MHEPRALTRQRIRIRRHDVDGSETVLQRLRSDPPAEGPSRSDRRGGARSYLAAAQIGFGFAVVAEQITTVWAPTGIALATLLLGGLRFWPAVWAGALLANSRTGAPIWTAFVIASGNTLEAALAVWVLRQLPGFTLPLSRVADVLRFLVVAAVFGTAVSATVGVVTLCAAGVQQWARFLELWFDWWLGDVLGAVIVAPAILAVARHEWSRRER